MTVIPEDRMIRYTKVSRRDDSYTRGQSDQICKGGSEMTHIPEDRIIRYTKVGQRDELSHRTEC